ncbi:hypothetical protein ACF0H5_023985 [Mactra antiquata]
MPSVAKGLFKWIFRRSATLEDLADRLNHFWTFGLLLLFAAIISWRQSYKNPIRCWSPASFTGAMIVYVEDVCWNSYFILDSEEERKMREKLEEKFNVSYRGDDVNPSFESRRKTLFVHQNQPTDDFNIVENIVTKRTIYQWLPLILCLQALLFKLPNLVLYVLHGYSGINFDKLAALTNGYENLTLLDRSVLSRRIGRYLYTWCKQCDNCLPWRHLTLLWFLTKILYCVNIIAQLSLVDGILTPEDRKNFGEVIQDNLYKEDAYLWRGAPAFPKNVFCNFDIQNLQNTQSWTVQCSLTANYFSEFTYMFIWVWLLFVAVVTCVSLFIWLVTTLIPIFRKRYITKALHMVDDNDFDMKSIPDVKISKFCDFLGEDGIMALKLTGTSSSEIIVSDVIQSMWNVWSGPNSRGGQVIHSPTYQSQSAGQDTIYPSLHTGDIPLVEQKME